MTPPPLPDPPIISGTIQNTTADTCLVDLGPLGMGHLCQEYSLARDDEEPLEQIPRYRRGETLRVFIQKEAHPGMWRLNERWAHDNPWEKLDLRPGDEVEGEVVRVASSGCVLRLDRPDIEVWLPEREIPWADGGTEAHRDDERAERIELELGDRTQALVIEIRQPPRDPLVSLRQLLERLEREGPPTGTHVENKTDSVGYQLGYRVHLGGGVAGLQHLLIENPSLKDKRLLVVEDDPVTLDALSRLLESDGAVVDRVLVRKSLDSALKNCLGLLGGTSGRTTLNGEGLQHQDGHSQVLANTVPSLLSYDPSFAYELTVIIREGMRRVYQEQEDLFYYITVHNQNYAMPAMPEGVTEGIIKGIYCCSRSSQEAKDGRKAHLLASGAIMSEVLKARQILEELGIATDVWSVTSYNQLTRQGLAAERRWLLHTDTEQRPYVEELLEHEQGVFVAASDHMKVLPLNIARWMPGPYVVLGTDGYGLCESRADLRAHFEVSAESIAWAALASLADVGAISQDELAAAAKRLAIDPDKPDAAVARPMECLETQKS